MLLIGDDGQLLEGDDSKFISVNDCPDYPDSPEYPTIRLVISGVSINTGCHDINTEGGGGEFGDGTSRRISGTINGTWEFPYILDTSDAVDVEWWNDIGCDNVTYEGPDGTHFNVATSSSGVSVTITADSLTTWGVHIEVSLFAGSVEYPSCKCKLTTAPIENIYTEYATDPVNINTNFTDGKGGTCTVEFIPA
jgi:hypothetical protein